MPPTIDVINSYPNHTVFTDVRFSYFFALILLHLFGISIAGNISPHIKQYD